MTGCRVIFAAAECTVSLIRVEALGGSVQGTGQVAGDGGQPVVYLANLTPDSLKFVPGFDTGQGCSMGFGAGADVLPPP